MDHDTGVGLVSVAGLQGWTERVATVSFTNPHLGRKEHDRAQESRL